MTPDTPSSSRSRARPTGRSRDPERSKAAILAAARELFVAHGFQGARTSEIARRAGVPQGLIYHYYAGKEELFDSVMEEAFAPYFQGMLDMLGQAENPDLGLLERSVRSYFEFLRDHPHVPRLLAWWMADEGWDQRPLIKKQNLSEAVELLGAQRIRQGQEAGIIRHDLDPAFVIKTFVDMCMMWHMSKGRHMLHCSPDCDASERDDEYLEHMIEVFMRGITAKTELEG